MKVRQLYFSLGIEYWCAIESIVCYSLIYTYIFRTKSPLREKIYECAPLLHQRSVNDKKVPVHQKINGALSSVIDRAI